MKRGYTLSEAALAVRRKGAKAKKPRTIDYSACTPEWLKTEYIDKKRSFRSIGEELGWHKNKVKNRLIDLGVEIRGHKEQATIAILSRSKAS